MPWLLVTDALGRTQSLQAESGPPLMELLRGLGMVDAVCGGGASCGTCAVRIEASWGERLPPPDEAESQLLEALEYDQAGGRLSCQLLISEAMDGMALSVLPPS